MDLTHRRSLGDGEAWLITRHGKAAAFAPVLQDELGLSLRTPGLPSADCGAPTQRAVKWILDCEGSGFVAGRPAPVEAWANPGECDTCNP